MGMEPRGRRFYYYEKRRVGGRVMSRYIGGGMLAEQASEIRAAIRQEREAIRNEKRKLHDEEKQIDRQIKEHGRSISAITKQCLLLAGFHQHKGQWRKKRLGCQ